METSIIKTPVEIHVLKLQGKKIPKAIVEQIVTVSIKSFQETIGYKSLNDVAQIASNENLLGWINLKGVSWILFLQEGELRRVRTTYYSADRNQYLPDGDMVEIRNQLKQLFI